MSIFDPKAGMNPLPWLQEKTLAALEEAARLVDLANEPDTTPWYAKTLRERAGRFAGRLAPVVAFLYEAGQKAASHEEWGLLLEGGSAALAPWCKKWDIADPTKVALRAAGAIVADGLDEAEDKAEAVPPVLIAVEDEHATDLRLDIYGACTRQLLHAELTESERRLELWLLAELWHSRHADIAVVSKKFLPGDIDCTPEDTAAAYRALYERGLIERVALPNLRPEALAVRLVVPGRNDSKHPAPYRAETFGFPGARVGGQYTSGNVLGAPLPAAVASALPGWSAARLAEELGELRSRIQEHLGDDRAFIEQVELAPSGGTVGLRVQLRQRVDDDDDASLRLGVEQVIEAWGRSQAARN
ncbi:MAG TPA: hypothetical protein VGQ83_00570 [Polyangia bacterium]|jgi:hypothetical protein